MKPESKSSYFRTLATHLRRRCADRGVDLDDGVAEKLLADHINATAQMLRISDHHAMRTYLSDDVLDQIADQIAQARRHRATEVDLSSPLLLPVTDAARVASALAMATLAATTGTDPITTRTAIRENGAAIVALAVAISTATDGQALIDPDTAVTARAELTRFLDNLTDGTWTTPDPRTPEQLATIIDVIRLDLARLG